MSVRRVPFAFATGASAPTHWNARRPEFSHIVNAASLAMPYLEPYLIKTIRAAEGQIQDAALKKDLALYVAQEASHFRQHKRFNETLAAAGYQSVRVLEAVLEKDYAALLAKRSLRFNLAYAEGFESMALAIGHMLIEDRVHLFGGSDSAVASLVLWHFVEEIEHKNVAFDVFAHIHGGYLWRMVGLFYATCHIFWRAGQGYRALLREDGLWHNVKSRWALAKILGRIFVNILPKWLRICKPGYHPSNIADPKWGRDWAALYAASPQGAANLDTARLSEDVPIAQPSKGENPS